MIPFPCNAHGTRSRLIRAMFLHKLDCHNHSGNGCVCTPTFLAALLVQIRTENTFCRSTFSRLGGSAGVPPAAFPRSSDHTRTVWLPAGTAEANSCCTPCGVNAGARARACVARYRSCPLDSCSPSRCRSSSLLDSSSPSSSLSLGLSSSEVRPDFCTDECCRWAAAIRPRECGHFLDPLFFAGIFKVRLPVPQPCSSRPSYSGYFALSRTSTPHAHFPVLFPSCHFHACMR
jgi:hypothetical protein